MVETTLQVKAERSEVRPLSLVMPVPWLTVLRQMRRPHNVWTAALVVRHWATQTNGRVVWVGASDAFAVVGMSRHAVSRALDRLEQGGLVRVDRARGRMPKVTVLDGPTPAHPSSPG